MRRCCHWKCCESRLQTSLFRFVVVMLSLSLAIGEPGSRTADWLWGDDTAKAPGTRAADHHWGYRCGWSGWWLVGPFPPSPCADLPCLLFFWLNNNSVRESKHCDMFLGLCSGLIQVFNQAACHTMTMHIMELTLMGLILFLAHRLNGVRRNMQHRILFDSLMYRTESGWPHRSLCGMPFPCNLHCLLVLVAMSFAAAEHGTSTATASATSARHQERSLQAVSNDPSTRILGQHFDTFVRILHGIADCIAHTSGELCGGELW